MKDQLSIKVSIAGRSYPLTIERSEEEAIRKAVKSINERVNDYEKNYNIKDRQDLLAMSSIFFASQAVSASHTSAKDEKFVLDSLAHMEKLVSAELKG